MLQIGKKFFLLFVVICGAQAETNYRVCVTEDAVSSCNALVQESSSRGLKLVCVPARDRVDCLDKIQEGEADFTTVEPEDMFVAAHMPSHNFIIVKEIRSKENPNEDHRYLAVSVIHANSSISSLQDLRGRKSCHTGVGRTVGYKIPVTKLSQLGVIDPLTSEEDLTPREFELRAFSRAFSKACIVGKWAPDDDTNQRLKKTYSNLCDMCEVPAQCDYPDNYSGYEGALKCLTQGGGDVAWTKFHVASKFFGLDEASEPQANADLFSYLCPDGTSQPVRLTSGAASEPCSWAGRPWLGFITRYDIDNIVELQRQISLAESISENAQKVLGITSQTTTVDREAITPLEFLAKSKFIDVIERNVGSSSPLRFCVRTREEEHKCEGLAAVAYSRDVRPRITCVRRNSSTSCMEAVRNRQADAVTLDALDAYKASRFYNIHAVMSENVTGTDAEYYTVAVAKKGSNKLLAPVSNTSPPESCHQDVTDTTGWKIPKAFLLQEGVLGAQHDCPLGVATAGFTWQNCALGAQNSNCPSSDSGDNIGETGALRCFLSGGSGDVAFLKASTFAKFADGASSEDWAAGLKSEDYKLLCPDGSTAHISQYRSCYLAQLPTRVVATSNYEEESRVESLRMAFLSLSNVLSTRRNLFSLFGPFEGHDNIMFTNKAIGLQILDPDLPVQRKFGALLDRFNTACPH